MASYGTLGWGGRQPVAYVGPQPRRRKLDEKTWRRPVVAVLDTGCGEHPWLDGVVKRNVKLDVGGDVVDIGYTDDETDPEKWFDQVGALDGGIDALSGHGTFISGLIHQACPDADILAWRVVGSDGPIVESELVKTLERIAEVARKHRDGEKGGYPIDVLNLSMGYYHETPKDQQFDKTMYKILEKLGRCGVAVVCSAGNDATAREMFPAAFGPWSFGTPTVPANPDAVPVTSVGALNPNGYTDALFSNAGPWVTTYAEGAHGDEHDAARLPGRPGAGGPDRGLPAGPRVGRPGQLQRRVRAVERDVLRGSALRRPGGRAARRRHRPRRTTAAKAARARAAAAVAAEIADAEDRRQKALAAAKRGRDMMASWSRQRSRRRTSTRGR